MAKLMFLLLLVLMTIFLFAGSGNPRQEQTYRAAAPAGVNALSASENLIASSTPATPPEEKSQPAVNAVEETPKHKLKLVPKDDNAELWILSDGEKPNGNTAPEVQIYNSAGERVFYTRLHATIQKVNLCNYKGGKYVVKVGDEVFNLMII